jgi:hypothetical protein
VLLQGEKAAQTLGAFMEDEGGQQASSAAIAIAVGVDGHELAVD